jgi:cell division protein FtsB
MRWLALAFIALIAALQFPMWLGKGGWLQVREFDRQLAAQKEANAKLKVRNDALDADVRDLKTGSEAIEERARSELGMVKQDEVFFQLRQRPDTARSETPGATPDSPPAGTTSLPIRPVSRPAEKR